ncbi:MAG: zinc ribbon domain-containing protein [Polyangiaceae bacterium]|nr:zinc ribbon domain-containing protein [Polyangiaceae bacterium]
MSKPATPPSPLARLQVPRWVLAALALAAPVIVGLELGLPAAILLLAAGALAAAVFLGYSSLLALMKPNELTLDEALTLVAPSNEEEQKRSVLRTLKDLEYEHAVGKISAADYAELVTHYRGEAKRLLKLVVEVRGDQLNRAEERATERLVAAGLAEVKVQPSRTAPADPSSSTRAARALERRPRCAVCGQRASRNARFCKACGARLAERPRTAPKPPPSSGSHEP